MKKKNLITILLAVVMLVTCTTAFVLAENHHITREDFFNSIAKALELTPSDMHLEFDDAESVSPEYKENIAAGVKEGYFFGRGNGLLDPKTEITLEEIDWVLDRINFKPETKYIHSTHTVTKTEYVEVPSEPVIIETDPMCIEADTEKGIEESHFYFLDTDGVYRCLCGKKEAPVGTVTIFRATTSTEGLGESYFETEGVEHEVSFETDYGRIYDWDEDETFPVACNAVCLDIEGNRVPYTEFMKEFDNQLRRVRYDFEEGTYEDKYAYPIGSGLIFIIQDLGEVEE